jgi:hypothetical protein
MNLYRELQDAYLGHASLRDLQVFCRFTELEAARFVCVAPATYRHWLRDRPASRTALRLLTVRAGFLPYPGWEGWLLRDGLLYPPGHSGTGFASTEVAALPFQYQRLAAFEADLRWQRMMSGRLAPLRRSA